MKEQFCPRILVTQFSTWGNYCWWPYAQLKSLLSDFFAFLKYFIFLLWFWIFCPMEHIKYFPRVLNRQFLTNVRVASCNEKNGFHLNWTRIFHGNPISFLKKAANTPKQDTTIQICLLLLSLKYGPTKSKMHCNLYCMIVWFQYGLITFLGILHYSLRINIIFHLTSTYGETQT